MQKAIYPGSFDPLTLGHIDIIKRVSKLFSEITVLVAQAENKTSLFTLRERRELILSCIQDLPNVKVETSDALTVDYARKNNIQILIRGLRGATDFEHEWVIAHMNKRLSPDIETFFILSDLQHSLVSSRVVKEIAVSGGPLESLVPQQVIPMLLERIRRSK